MSLSPKQEDRIKKLLLNSTYKKLTGLSPKQDELIRQSLRFVENDLFRAAYILSWISLIDLIEEKLFIDKFVKLKSIKTSWSYNTIEELRDNQSEYNILDACKEVGIINKTELKIFIGYLNERHQCAHPTNFFPNFYQTIGYISNIVYNIEIVQKRPYP